MGLLKSIGKMSNLYSGATDAAQRQQKYALQSMYLNNQFQKEAAQNAHQWEMADLKAAGLNPALTATGGSGANLSGGGIASGGGQTNGAMDMIGMFNNTRQTNAATRLQESQAIKNIAETNAIPNYLKNDTIRALAEDINAKANATNAETNRQTAEAGIGGKVFGNKHGGAMTSLLVSAAPLIGIPGATKAYGAYKTWKAARGFAKFIKSVK